jgi:hypothetical protein
MRGAVRGFADFSGCAPKVIVRDRKRRTESRNFQRRRGRFDGQQGRYLDLREFIPKLAAAKRRCTRMRKGLVAVK